MSNSLPMVSVNGVPGAALSPLDRGLTYGDGIFETCLLRQGYLPLWSWHRDRLVASATRLQIPLNLAHLEGYIEALLTPLGAIEGVLKVLVTRGEGGRGYRLPAQPAPSYCLVLNPGVQATPQAVELKLCKIRLATNSALAGLKHLNRLEQVLARAEWSADDDTREGLLLDQQGLVIEATSSNLFLVSAGRLLTPDLSHCGVAGVMRRLIIEKLAPALGLEVVVTSVPLALLEAADEIFLCNSVRGIWPVVAFEARSLPLGPVTSRLRLAWVDWLDDQSKMDLEENGC